MSSASALPGLRETGESAVEVFAFVCILATSWGEENMLQLTDGTLVRESSPCTMLLYRGYFSGLQFCRVLRPLAAGSLTTLAGASPGCYAWSGNTHDLALLPWPEGAGFSCLNCHDTLT